MNAGSILLYPQFLSNCVIQFHFLVLLILLVTFKVSIKSSNILHIIFSLIYFSLAKLRLHTENQLYIMLGSDLKVCVGGWVGGGGGGGVESEFSDRFGLA